LHAFLIIGLLGIATIVGEASHHRHRLAAEKCRATVLGGLAVADKLPFGTKPLVWLRLCPVCLPKVPSKALIMSTGL
jgi:hypothetical protein